MGTSHAVGTVYAFCDYELDTRLCELRRAGASRHLEPQVFAVLAYLLEHHDRVVSKNELLDEIWGHRFVSPNTLNSRIKLARQAVGDDGSTQRVIRTVHGRGFRVIAQVKQRLPSLGGPPVDTRSSPEPSLQQSIHFCTAGDGTRLAYATSGEGPPLVKPATWLTHLEYDWQSPVWRHWLHELSRSHTLVRYDERGSGLSDRVVEDLSFEAWVRDLEALVDAMGLERFPLFGLSQGVAVAIAYAARHPERVSGLVLCGGFLQGYLHRARDPEQASETMAVLRAMTSRWGRDNPAHRQFFASMFLPEGTPEQHRWFSELQRVTTSPETALRLLTTVGQIDVTELAPLVKAPTLVLHATGDGVISFNQGRKVAAAIPGARFVPLESRNHVLLGDEPAWPRFLQELRTFLARA